MSGYVKAQNGKWHRHAQDLPTKPAVRQQLKFLPAYQHRHRITGETVPGFRCPDRGSYRDWIFEPTGGNEARLVPPNGDPNLKARPRARTQCGEEVYVTAIQLDPFNYAHLGAFGPLPGRKLKMCFKCYPMILEEAENEEPDKRNGTL